MPKGEITFRVNRPPEEVFSWVGDLEKAPEWVPDLVSMKKVSEGPIGVGSRYREVVKMGNKEGEGSLEVTEYDPPRLFAHKGQGGPSRFTGRFVLEPDGDGTKVTHEYTVQMTGMMKLMSAFIGSWVRKNTEAGVKNLQKILA